jgi:hypothetical protein
MRSEEFELLLDQYGERVAVRAYLGSMSRQDRIRERIQTHGNGLAAFYTSGFMLRIDQDDPLPGFDPFEPGECLHHFYGNHPDEGHQHFLSGKEHDCWATRLAALLTVFGDWAVQFVYRGLVLGESSEVEDQIADDQGDFVTPDGAKYCGWIVGWRGWTHWAQKLSEQDISVIKDLLTPGFKIARRWPEPGSHDAEALIDRNNAANEQEQRK